MPTPVRVAATTLRAPFHHGVRAGTIPLEVLHELRYTHEDGPHCRCYLVPCHTPDSADAVCENTTLRGAQQRCQNVSGVTEDCRGITQNLPIPFGLHYLQPPTFPGHKS